MSELSSKPTGRRGRDRMVVGFTTSYVISPSSNLDQGEVYNIM